MAYQNKFGNQASFNMGKEAEENFKKLLIKKGYQVTDASRAEDMAHTDFWATKDNIKTSFECKSAKKLWRGDSEVNYNFIYVEWANVQGKQGWLLEGAEYLAFGQLKSFLIVKRQLLKNWCEKVCDLTKKVDLAEDSVYKSYTRRNRLDVISLIKTSDLKLNVPFEIWCL